MMSAIARTKKVNQAKKMKKTKANPGAPAARIDHIALWSEDIERLAGFYANYFGAAAGPLYANKQKGFVSRFLSFAGGARIEIMKTTAIALARSDPGEQKMGMTHFAIATGSEQQVDELTLRLGKDGFMVLHDPRRTGDGCYESVVLDPDGNRIELTI
jgi:lactoylglutathione lyase